MGSGCGHGKTIRMRGFDSDGSTVDAPWEIVCKDCGTIIGIEDAHMATPRDRKEVKGGVRKDTPFHFDEGKPPVEQLPTESLEAIAHIFGYGAGKYGPYNWLEYATEWDWTQLYASCLRHLYAWHRREDQDQESGLPHLAHAGANILMLLQLIHRKCGTDDRPPV